MVTTVATTVLMDSQGRMTIPADVRLALGIEEGAQFEVSVVEGSLVLRLVVAIPEEDLWAYTPEEQAKIRRALKEGRGREMTEADLKKLMGL